MKTTMRKSYKGRGILAALVLGMVTASLLVACGDATPTAPATTALAPTTAATTTTAPTTTVNTTTVPATTNVPATTADPATTQAPATTNAATTAAATQPATTTQPAGGQVEPLFEDRTTPENLMKAFYNAIDRKEYQRAYGYWQTTGQADTPANYDQFAKGYADTAKVTFTLGQVTQGAATGNLYASIPAVLVSTHTNGKQETFAGCYIAHRVNTGVSSNPADELWRFTNGKFASAAAGTLPSLALCAGSPGPSGYDNRTSPEGLVQSFYNAIDLKDYQRAYGYWEAPGKGNANTPGSYDQFAKGYSDTVSVTYKLGNITSDAGAGNIYASIPIVLTSTHTDGSKTTFAGCYIAHRVNDGISSDPKAVLWGFRSGTLAAASANAQPDPKSCKV